MPRSTRTIFHMHIPKTAGTTVNRWIESFAHGLKCRPDGYFRQFGQEMSEGIFLHQVHSAPPTDLPPVGEPTEEEEAEGISVYDRQLRTWARWVYSWNHFDVLHGHESLLTVRPEGACVFTVLRRPVAKAVSQFVDHATLTRGDFASKTSEYREVALFVHEHGLDAGIERHADSRYMKSLYHDQQCRILLGGTCTAAEFFEMSVEERAARTIEWVDRTIDVVGYYEHLAETLRLVAARHGVCPPTLMPRLNARPAHDHLRDISAAAKQWFIDVARADQIVYDHYRAAFERAAVATADYDLDRFEALFAADRVREISPVAIGRERLFDMNMALVGSGFHQREATGTIDCQRWSGPGDSSTLFMPVPPGVPLRLRLHTKGWEDWSRPEALHVLVDGVHVPHRLEHPPRMANAIVVDVRTERPFVRLTIDLYPEGRGDTAPPPTGRGYSLWAYGYEVLD